MGLCIQGFKKKQCCSMAIIQLGNSFTVEMTPRNNALPLPLQNLYRECFV